METEGIMSTKINRKDLLLLLLYSPGPSGEAGEPIDGRTRLMKLLFLLQQDYPVEKILTSSCKYDFQAYHYGPFTKDVYNDLEFLENVGLIEASSRGIIASPVEQNEEEQLVENTSIGESKEDLNITFEEERFKLTERGLNFVINDLLTVVPHELLQDICELKSKFLSQPLISLLRYVYNKYPEYANKTKLKYLIDS
jgi:uncharacterized protein YwgA